MGTVIEVTAPAQEQLKTYLAEEESPAVRFRLYVSAG